MKTRVGSEIPAESQVNGKFSPPRPCNNDLAMGAASPERHTEQHKVIFPKDVPGEGLRQREEMRQSLCSTQRTTCTVGFIPLLQHGRGFSKVQLLFRASEKSRDLQGAHKNVKKTPRSGNNPTFSGVYNSSSRKCSRHCPTSFRST